MELWFHWKSFKYKAPQSLKIYFVAVLYRKFNFVNQRRHQAVFSSFQNRGSFSYGSLRFVPILRFSSLTNKKISWKIVISLPQFPAVTQLCVTVEWSKLVCKAITVLYRQKQVIKSFTSFFSLQFNQSRDEGFLQRPSQSERKTDRNNCWIFNVPITLFFLIPHA